MVEKNKRFLHPGALKRQEASPINYPPYHPTTILKIGQRHSVDIFADTRWNSTGLYLEQGHAYTFSADGQWLDSKDRCDWNGTQDGQLTSADILRGTSSFLGQFEKLYKNSVPTNQRTSLQPSGSKTSTGFAWSARLPMTQVQTKSSKMTAARSHISMSAYPITKAPR